MAKKNIVVLSVPELLKRVSAGFMVRHVKDEDIDCSDIPEMTPEVLKNFKRVRKKKKAI